MLRKSVKFIGEISTPLKCIFLFEIECVIDHLSYTPQQKYKIILNSLFYLIHEFYYYFLILFYFILFNF